MRDVIVVGGRGLTAQMCRALLDLAPMGDPMLEKVILKPLDYMDISRDILVRRQCSDPFSGLNENGIPRKRKKGR
jgi:hypothetical protein